MVWLGNLMYLLDAFAIRALSGTEQGVLCLGCSFLFWALFFLKSAGQCTD